MGIEPTAQAWEAWVLPLYDARDSAILVALRRINQCWGAEMWAAARPRRSECPRLVIA